MELSVIIVNYNVRFFLEQCLYSVYKSMYGLQAEVIVIDNNSVDGSLQMVQEKFPEIILIANKDNLGFSKANNQGLKIAKGKYVLVLNPDTVVEENTFHKCIEFMDSHPKAGSLGVKMIDGRGNFLPESKRALPTPAVSFLKYLVYPHSSLNQNFLGATIWGISIITKSIKLKSFLARLCLSVNRLCRKLVILMRLFLCMVKILTFLTG
jgi:GT2 family glycosyltransferase